MWSQQSHGLKQWTLWVLENDPLEQKDINPSRITRLTEV
jgi:hypothetical protein